MGWDGQLYSKLVQLIMGLETLGGFPGPLESDLSCPGANTLRSTS